jgi:hypothetical protein
MLAAREFCSIRCNWVWAGAFVAAERRSHVGGLIVVDSLLIVVLFLLGVSGFLAYCRALISVGSLVRGFLAYCSWILLNFYLLKIRVRCAQNSILLYKVFGQWASSYVGWTYGV